MLLLGSTTKSILLLEECCVLFHGFLTLTSFDAVDSHALWKLAFLLCSLSPCIFQYWWQPKNYYGARRMSTALVFNSCLMAYGMCIRLCNSKTVEWGTGQEYSKGIQVYSCILSNFGLACFTGLMWILVSSSLKRSKSFRRPLIYISSAFVADLAVYYLYLKNKDFLVSLYRYQVIFPYLLTVCMHTLPIPNPPWAFWIFFLAERIMVPLFWSYSADLSGLFDFAGMADALALKTMLVCAILTNENSDIFASKGVDNNVYCA